MAHQAGPSAALPGCVPTRYVSPTPAPFERAEFEELSARLQTIKGQFIVSLNAVPEVRQIFSWAKIEAVEMRYQAAGHKHARRLVKEAIITAP